MDKNQGYTAVAVNQHINEWFNYHAQLTFNYSLIKLVINTKNSTLVVSGSIYGTCPAIGHSLASLLEIPTHFELTIRCPV